jgi:hypothetical protein
MAQIIIKSDDIKEKNTFLSVKSKTNHILHFELGGHRRGLTNTSTIGT